MIASMVPASNPREAHQAWPSGHRQPRSLAEGETGLDDSDDAGHGASIISIIAGPFLQL